MEMDLEAKKAELLATREQIMANLNFVNGQLALIEQQQAPPPPPPNRAARRRAAKT